MPHLISLIAVSLLTALSLFSPIHAGESNCDQRVAIQSLDKIRWMVGTSEGKQKLKEDVDGVAKKGDLVSIRVTTEEILDGKYFMATGYLVHKGRTHELFREVWGKRPSDTGIYKWVFDRSGLVLEGRLYLEGEDKIVHVIQGEMIPDDEQFNLITQKLGVEKLSYFGEMVFRRIDDNTLGVTVQAVKIGGLPFPWPNLNNEEIFRDVEQD